MRIGKRLLTWLTFSAVIGSLVGCQLLVDTTEDRQEELQVEEKEQMKIEPMTEEEYEVAVDTKATDFYNTLIEMLTFFTEKQTIDQADLKRLYADYDALQNLSNEITALVPPPSYEKADEAYKKSMYEFDLYLEGFKKALDNREFSSLPIIHEHASLGEKWLNRANGLLAITYDRVLGDGTITTADLKRLEDGNELIGKWGYYNEDGTFNVSLVLEADGRYSGYATGEYPETDMTGIWKYEFLDHLLIFEHDNSDFRTMTMDLQSFKEDSFKLLDIDTWRAFYYVKEGSPNTSED